jgi:hypothetical protein
MRCVASEVEVARDVLGTFGTLGNVPERGWNVPLSLVCLTPMNIESRERVCTARGRLGRLKSSQVVPRRGLDVRVVAGVIECDVT